MTDHLNAISITQTFDDFIVAKADELTRRTLRKYGEVLSLLGEYLEDHGITTIERGPQGAATIKDILELIEEFNDDYLIRVIDAERDFLRSATSMSRELSRWLRTKRMSRQRAARSLHAEPPPHLRS